MIKDRLDGLSVCEMKDDELKTLSDICIFKIAAISGFSLSTDTTFADVLRDEFVTFLSEYGFNNLTFSEIVSAFRMNARGEMRYESGDFITQVKPYSSFFNLIYAGEVLKNYIALRKSLDCKIINCMDGNNDFKTLDGITKTL